MRPVSAVLTSIGAGALVVVISTMVAGMPLPWAVLVALPVAGTVLLAAVLSGAVDANWAAQPDERGVAVELQASMLEARLADAARDRHRYRTRLRPRLRRLALAVAWRRIGGAEPPTLDDPRVPDVLGPRLYTLLTDDRVGLPPPGQLARLLAALNDETGDDRRDARR